MPFPKDFMWGAATASYQIEGAATEDGRGECIWTRFSHTPGKIAKGHTGDTACDHYHRYTDDIALMQSLGLKAYRFSVSWSRVLPTGAGAVNPKGMDFYNRLVDDLLEAGIAPYLTLYHWDLPQALQDDGDGWENPAIVQQFADYAGLMGDALGDRVNHWITINEPWVVAFKGNYDGEHAPGKTDLAAAYRVAHHLMLGHGAAVRRLRDVLPEDANVGITLDYNPVQPATDSENDLQMARIMDGYKNRWFLDAVFTGTYPADVVEAVRGTDGALRDIDLAAVASANPPIDFLGLNYYTRWVVRDMGSLIGELVPQPGEHTAMGWEVYPDGLYDMLTRVHADYDPDALYITENGAAYDDPAPAAGVVDDPEREAYLSAHFDAAEQAIGEGVPLVGYFVWSLLDNFEWAYGYDKRFGIVHVNYDTLVRTPKRSALFYRDFIAGQG